MNGVDINSRSFVVPPIIVGVYSGSAVWKSDLIEFEGEEDDIRNCEGDKQLCGLQLYVPAIAV